MKPIIAILTAIGLAACAGPSDGTRSIGLSHSVPVSSTAFVKDVDSIVKERDYSYVTLTVTRPNGKKPKSTSPARSVEVTTGSGFVVDNKGHVVTAAHVAMSKNWRVNATGPHGTKYTGRVVALQPIGDMALVKLDKPDILTPVKPVKDPCILAGASIISLGKPGLRQDVARIGTLLKLRFGKKVRYQKFGYDEAMVMKLQTRRGESGGPVFDHSGAFLGMIVSTLSSASGAPLNLAHAVPTPRLGKFICARTKCLPAWRKLRKKRMSSCPAPETKSVRAG